MSWFFVYSQTKATQEDVYIPDDLGGEAEARLLLARGDGDRLSLPAGLMLVSG